jgi:hypothetical protein
MNTGLKEKRVRLERIKLLNKNRLTGASARLDAYCEDFAAADMALNEFDRRHGGEE